MEEAGSLETASGLPGSTVACQAVDDAIEPALVQMAVQIPGRDAEAARSFAGEIGAPRPLAASRIVVVQTARYFTVGIDPTEYGEFALPVRNG